MKRIELIACEAVRAELVEALEGALADLEYTLVPRIEGKGLSSRKEGTQVWPEYNFMLVAYVEDSQLPAAREAIRGVAARFPREGIFAGASEAQSLR